MRCDNCYYYDPPKLGMNESCEHPRVKHVSNLAGNPPDNRNITVSRGSGGRIKYCVYWRKK